MSSPVFLIGLPGSGKTTEGKKLATHLGIPFLDLDEEIEKNIGQTISSVFSEKGESYFRVLERKQLHAIISSTPRFVMATGGGTPCFFDNMTTMQKSGKTIFLNPPLHVIKKRLLGDDSRPLLRAYTFETLLEKRMKWYTKAELTVSSWQELFDLFKN